MKRVTGPALELHPVSRPRGISFRPAGKMPYLRPVWSRGAFGARHPSGGKSGPSVRAPAAQSIARAVRV